MHYIFVEEQIIGFKVEGIHEIKNTDTAISKENYNRFFEEQSQGKQFKLKNINGSTFEEIFEEYAPEIVTVEPEPSSEDYLIDLDFRLSMIELGGI